MASPKLTKRVQQLLADILHREMNDPRIQFASVTKVELSKDNRYCTAYISILGEPTQQRTVMRGIEHARGFIQSKLGERLALRYIPSLKFVQDYSIEKSVAMSVLLREALKDSPAPALPEATEPQPPEDDEIEEEEYEDEGEDEEDEDDDDEEDDEDEVD